MCLRGWNHSRLLLRSRPRRKVIASLEKPGKRLSALGCRRSARMLCVAVAINQILHRVANPFLVATKTEMLTGRTPSAESLQPLSVLRHSRINAVGPRQNASCEITHFLESCLPQEIDCLAAAHAGAAVRDDLAAGVELVHALGQIAKRDQISVQVADLIFVRLAHIEDKDVLSGIESLLQLFGLNLGHVGGHWRFFSADTPA